jgi:hypothetical protein
MGNIVERVAPYLDWRVAVKGEFVQPKEVLPEGWGARLCTGADIDASFEELRGTKHWFADSQRGRLRSLQLREGEADAHFLAARDRMGQDDDAVETEASCGLLHCAFEREHALVCGRPAIPHPAVPSIQLADEVLNRILDVHRCLDATECLANGHVAEARDQFTTWLEDRRKSRDRKLPWHIGLAVCLWLLGEEEGMLSQLEFAGLTMAAQGYPLLVEAQFSARLAAVYRVVGELGHAADWEAYLGRLPVHRSTLDLFRRRGAALLDKNHTQALVVLT